MTTTTENIPPVPKLDEISGDNSKVTEKWHSWFNSLRDQSLGKNRVSDIQQLSVSDIISPLSENIRIESTGGAITLTSNPQIYAWFDGKIIDIEGMSDTNTVELVNGNGLSLTANFTLKNNSIIRLHYSKSKNLWIEHYRRA